MPDGIYTEDKLRRACRFAFIRESICAGLPFAVDSEALPRRSDPDHERRVAMLVKHFTSLPLFATNDRCEGARTVPYAQMMESLTNYLNDFSK